MADEINDYSEKANEMLLLLNQFLKSNYVYGLYSLMQGEFLALFLIGSYADTGIISKDLSEAMGVSSARVAALLGSLEKKNLIWRTPDPYDHRKIKIYQTELGKRKFSEIYGELKRNTSILFSKLGEDDVDDILRILRKIVNITPELVIQIGDTISTEKTKDNLTTGGI